MTGTTKENVSSQGLVLLGHPAISSFSEETPAANALVERYETLKEKCLADYPWNFTIKKVQLSQDSVAPVSTWDHKYLLPSDGLADGVLALYSDDSSNELQVQDYVIQSGYVLSNYDALWADYQAKKDESTFPPHFINFLAHAIAADLAYLLTKSRTLAEDMHRKCYGLPGHNGIGGEYGRARKVDSYSGPANQRIVRYPLVEARFGGVGPWRS